MDLVLRDLGKLYAQNWIFKDLNYSIENGSRWGIRGSNGAGKSTLLHLLLGLHLPSKGSVSYIHNGEEIPRDQWGARISFAAPYAGLPLEFSALEMVRMSLKFRPLTMGLTPENVLHEAFLIEHQDKLLGEFSTGMLQRFKVALAVCTASEVLILDEPTSNLDIKGKTWFNDLMDKYHGHRTVIIASNEESDFKHCHSFIDLNVSTFV